MNFFYRSWKFDQIPGIVEIHARELIVEEVRGRTLEWLERIELNGAALNHSIKDELHRMESHEVQGLTAAFGMVIALAVSIATSGAGTGLGGALAGSIGMTTTTAAGATILTTAGAITSTMTAAAFTSLCSQAALAVLNNNGDLGKAAKSLLSSGSLKSLGVDVAMAGLTGGGAKPNGFMGHLAQQVHKGAYRMMVEKIAYGKTDERGAALTALSSAVGATISADIGSAHYNGDIQGLAHKGV